MKQFFLALCCGLPFFALAQSQDFNDPAVLTTLSRNCWSFSGMRHSVEQPINGSGHLYLSPTTGTAVGNSAQLITAFLSLQSGATVRFRFRLTTRLSTNARRFITYRLQDNTTSQVIRIDTLDRNTPITTQGTIPVNLPASVAAKRLRIDFTGEGDGNTGMFIDDLFFEQATYAPTVNCQPSLAMGAILPMQLLYFTTGRQNGRDELRWQVAENESGSHFEVEESRDGQFFSTIFSVPCTPESGRVSYRLELSTRQVMGYYRLKLVNRNGSISYSQTIRITSTAESAGLQLLENPVSSTLRFSYTASVSGKVTVIIFDGKGRQCEMQTLCVEAGRNRMSLPVNGPLAPGPYLLQVYAKGQAATIRFVKR
jgi:hypothetical protein